MTIGSLAEHCQRGLLTMVPAAHGVCTCSSCVHAVAGRAASTQRGGAVPGTRDGGGDHAAQPAAGGTCNHSEDRVAPHAAQPATGQFMRLIFAFSIHLALRDP